MTIGETPESTRAPEGLYLETIKKERTLFIFAPYALAQTLNN